MSNLQFLNPKAEVLKKIQALAMNINAAMGLQEVMKSNLGPKGTLKMYAVRDVGLSEEPARSSSLRTETFCYTRCRFSTPQRA
jgi:hypothetical protein